MLRNDKGQTEDSHCSGFPWVCTWDDVQAWSRELDKRRARAFVWLNVYDADPAASKVPPAVAEQLRGWANSAAVVEDSKLSDSTFGLPSEERIERIIASTNDGERYLSAVARVDPASGPIVGVDAEQAPSLRWYHWLAIAAVGGVLLGRAERSRE
jgi:hypothetical protein